MTKVVLWLSLVFLAFNVSAKQYTLPNGGNKIIGKSQFVKAKSGDTLNRLGLRHGLGYGEMIKANRKWGNRKIPSGTSVKLPTKYQLPNTPRKGIVVNLADMRLYFYPRGSNTVHTFPIAVGKRGWSTPKGNTSVIAKHKHPTWTPPASIRRESSRRGRTLRRVYPAGPNNPLGTRALRLGLPGFLIHGTNNPSSIGRRVSHGCIRMRRSDIERLFSLVPVNTKVAIISQGTRLNHGSSSGTRVAKKSSSRSKKSIKNSKKTNRAKKLAKRSKKTNRSRKSAKRPKKTNRAKKLAKRTKKTTRANRAKKLAKRSKKTTRANRAKKLAKRSKKTKRSRKLAKRPKKTNRSRKLAKRPKKTNRSRKSAKRSKKTNRSRKSAKRSKKTNRSRKLAKRPKKTNRSRKSAKRSKKTNRSRKNRKKSYASKKRKLKTKKSSQRKGSKTPYISNRGLDFRRLNKDAKSER